MAEDKQADSYGSVHDDAKLDLEHNALPPKLDEHRIAEITDAEFDDPNLDVSLMGDVEEDSPYPEVRAAVANTDDPDMPCNTIRTWVLGMIFTVLIAGMNQFFFFRFPSVQITALAAQLIVFPFGRLWAYIVPNWRIFGASLNPGRFTVKEHVLVTIMCTVGSASAYATDIIAVQRYTYNQVFPFGYQWLLVMSTQLIGFSLGGALQRFLVTPPSMIWPANLVVTALFNTLHHAQYSGMGNYGGMSRERFFTYVLVGSILWYFFPGYIFAALSNFDWVCWIAPQNIKVNQMFGYSSGLGMSVITFDWAQITYIGSPLATPWWAEANVAVGFVFFFWFLTPIFYYANVWNSTYMPISGRGSFDNTAGPYNVKRILNPDITFNETAYKAYSPLFLPATFAISYGISFASITAILTHTILYFRKQIWTQARRSLNEQPDVHARLMSVYKRVPEWWYGILFLIMFAFGILCIELWPTEMPVWAFVLALAIAAVYVIPIGMIQAITNQQIGLNVITELIIGFALPGRPIAMMMFKTLGYISMVQALAFASDFKLGHYMKIPPRPMFWGQIVATVIAGTVQIGVQDWMFGNIPGMCTPKQKNGFICPSTQVFSTASIVWGVIGPQRQFAAGQVYYGLVFGFLIGAILPAIGYFFSKRYPQSWIKYVNFPVIFNGTGAIPPATAVNYVPWTIVGFIFQYIIRRRHFGWWAKYNYVLSAGLDSGLALGLIIIFFCLQYPKNGTIGETTIQTWWGNTVFANTADWASAPLRTLAPNTTFGPKTW